MQQKALRQHKLTLLAASSAVVLTMMVLVTTALEAAPYRPSDDSEILETLPDHQDADLVDLAESRVRLMQTPNDLALALDIAKAYAKLGRRKGDPRYEGYARAALAPWWSLERPPFQVRLLRAHLHQRSHDFDAALDDIEAVLAERPGHRSALLAKAMILAVKGEPDQAAKVCDRLSVRDASLVAAGCAGHVGRLIGRAGHSYDAMKDALAGDPEAEPALRAWLLTVMAESSLQLEVPEPAEQHLIDALSLEDRDPYILGAYADLLLDQGRHTEVIALLQGHERNDSLLLRLAIAERQLGYAAADDHIDQLRIRFEEAARRKDTVHLREEARFTLSLLERPEDALNLALENWRSQRERADARLVLEAAMGSDQPAAAAPVLTWMAKTGIEDAVLEDLADSLKRRSS